MSERVACGAEQAEAAFAADEKLVPMIAPFLVGLTAMNTHVGKMAAV